MTVKTDQASDGDRAEPGGDTPTNQAAPEPQPSWRRQVHKAMTKPLTLPWWTAYALVAVVPFVLVFGLWSRWGAAQWGDVATWLSGMSTFAAVAVALRQTVLARKASAAAIKDAKVARIEADLRVEREINAYHDRVEAQLKKSDELHERQARAEYLATQRAELMVYWPVFDKTHWAAITLPSSHVMTSADREEWRDQRAHLVLATSRVLTFVHEPEVRAAIRSVGDAFESFDRHLTAVASGELTFADSESATNARKMRMTAIRAARSALQDKASARLVVYAPESVKRKADAWSTPLSEDKS